MAENIEKKGNAKYVDTYHKKLSEIKVRFPNPENCGKDYLSMMRDRALELGFEVDKGKNKGAGNINAYILYLIEQDLFGTDPDDKMIKVPLKKD